MKKVLFILLAIMLSVSVMAQQRIQLRSVDRAECTSSDMNSLRASFSFSTIEAQDYASVRGTFSWLSLPNTVIGGNEGDPQIPVVNELIAVPFGAQPRIEITSYSTTDYRLNDLGIHTLVPRQPSLRKDQRPEDVPFVMNQAAYQTRGFRSEPMAVVNVVGTMRGVQLGKLTIEPVSYDPVNNTLRVFNDIEVTVHFDGADAQATEQMLLDTYSPYFNGIYSMLFNGRSIRSAYDDHPDLYTTPVKMLVVTTSTYANSTPFQNWLNWKKQKGIDVDVQTVTSSTTSANVRSLIQSRYNANHPTFLVIVGDETAVKYYTTYSVSGLNYNPYCSDLQYASIDDDVYHDMFMSRMSVSSTTELGYLVDKILMYEKYTMPDPSYLNNVLLIAGADATWAPRVGRPTINYAADNYFNTAHGFSNVYKYVTDSYTGCYNYLSSGVGFVNYTAHGDIQEWYSPNFTNDNVNALTNTNKYFWAMGNCCLTANFGNSSYSPCYGEAMIRAQNKGAFGYIGSVPESYWWEDYYFGVGATSTYNQTPSMSQTTTGVYDFMFDDTQMNTLNSVPYAGNVAVTYAHANNYTSSVSDEYYWRGYQCFGDGSVMPYHVAPAANNVSHSSSIVAGTNSFRVNADAGSYVAITVNNNIIGVAAVPANATYVDVPFTTTPVAGTTAMIVVTRNQRQPYINDNVPVINNNAPQYTITVNVSPANSGTVEGGGTYYENTECTLTAVANHGYAFQKWNDNNTNNPRTFTVTGNATYTATFRALEEHHVNYTAQQTHGTISVSPTDAYMGDIVTLTATPELGYALDYWTVTTGRETIPVENNQFVMPDSEVTVSATFKSEPINLTVNGTNTTTNSYVPIYGLYADYGCHSQFIIPASDLSGIPAGSTITKLTFYCDKSSQSYFGSKAQVQIGEVNYTTFSSTSFVTSGLNTVTASSTTTLTTNGSGELEIEFNSPYTYNGGNLLIGIGGYGSQYASTSWTGVSKSGNVAIYKYNSSSGTSIPSGSGTGVSFAPKTTITYTPSADPSLILSPNAATILIGFTETLTASTLNVTGTPSITFTSSNTNVATVSGNGNTATVTAVASGTATITASMTYEGTVYTATCAITVEEPSYCTPNPTSRDGQGITTLTFGSGDYIVNNSNSNGLPASAPYYGDYTSMVGGYGAGETATVTITYSTGSSTVYSYGTLIWVDWNKNYTFEDSEIVYTGTSAQGSGGTPQVLTATFTIPASQAADDYRMRIAGADSYFDSYIGGSSSANHDPCFTSTWAVCHDYTLRVISLSNDPVEITATANPANAGTITGAGTYTPGTQCTLTATANEGYTFTNWTKNGVAVSTNANYSFTVSSAAAYVANFTPNSYTITATAVPAEGGTVTVGGRNRDDLFYDFEDGTYQGWTTFQGNTTSPHSWMHITEYSYAYNYSTMSSGHGYNESDGYMYSESYITGESSGNGTAVTPDNYLVSPQIRLGGSITFHAGAQNVSYCAEHFSLMVSTTGNNAANNFTAVQTWTFTPTATSGSEWQEFTVDLSAYSGMGYIAIRHFDCNDEWFLCIDDITIVEGQDPSTGNGNFLYGTTCTVVATPNGDYHFVNWTENGIAVSTDATYSFTVTGDRDLEANFSLVQPTFYTIDVTVNPANAGTVTGAGSYAEGSNVTLTATANEGFTFVNWTKDGVEVSTETSYTFTVNDDATYVANFQQPVSQVVTLTEGWNWWTPNVELEGDALLAQMEDALGANGVRIAAQGGETRNYSTSNGWTGNLNELLLSRMYKIQTNAACSFIITGSAYNPAEHPVTIAPGINWIGFFATDEMDISVALAGLQPAHKDYIKAGNKKATYYEGIGWVGSLSVLVPGQGYVYYSNETTTIKTFTYPSAK